MDIPYVIDNISKRVIDDLHGKPISDSRISIAAASFSIYAFEALKNELESIEEMRFIFTSPTFIADKVKKGQDRGQVTVPQEYRKFNIELQFSGR